MHTSDFTDVDPDFVRRLLEQGREGRYELVDVRQEREYAQGRIPGSMLLPLGELPARISEIPPDRDVIFYCRSGRRSRAAALLLAESGRHRGRIFNLAGGMMAWDGIRLAGTPDLRVIDPSRDLPHVLYQAMNLEKGAHRFYLAVLDRMGDSGYRGPIDLLARAEEAHARLLYGFWAEAQAGGVPSFAEVYASLPGDVLEGGQPLEAALDVFGGKRLDCVQVLEMALAIEYAAFDLYRNLARRVGASTAERLLAVADAEKEHMRIAAEALGLCGP